MGVDDRMDVNVVSYLRPNDRPGEASLTFHLKVNGVSMPVVQTPPLEVGGPERLERAYRELPEYCWVEARFMAAHYAWIGCDGEADVELRLAEPIRQVEVFPSRRKIEPELDGNCLHFKASPEEPRYFLVSIDHLPLFCLLIDPLEEAVDPDDCVDIRQFMLPGETGSDLAVLVERALAVVNGSGKILSVAPGEYVSGQVTIAHGSNFTLYLAPGVLIRTRISDPGAVEHCHGLWLDDCHDVRVTGRGTIDHQGYQHFAGGRISYQHGLVSYVVPNPESPFTSQSPLTITRCSDVLVDGLALRNSRNFNVNLRASERVTLRRVKVITASGSVPEYTDGFQINSCQDTLLENCFAVCSDDCIASGHYFYSIDNRETDHTRVHGFVGFNPRANGVRLGYYSHYSLGSFSFDNCDFAGETSSGVLIHALADAPEAGRYQFFGTVRFSDCGFDRCDRYSAGLIRVEGARLDRLMFERVRFDRKPKVGSLIRGDSRGGIGELVIHEMTIAGEKIRNLQSASIETAEIREVKINQ